MSGLPRAARRWLAGAVAVVVGLGLLPALAGTASADTAPTPPTTVKTVAADALPTVQINGVVWDQVIVGNTVYVAGSFTSARPAGSASGSNETARSNLLAYNITTGNLITSWAPTVNAQALVIAASADGKTIYAGGDFSQANGVAMTRLAAFDATSGALVSGFSPAPNGRVRALYVAGSTLYVGGAFSTIGGQARTRVAAMSATTGALTPWAPNLDDDVYAIVAPAGSNRVILGGRFETANGTEVKGLAALDAGTAATQPWEAYGVMPNFGPNSSFYSLSTDGTQVFGSAYDYYGPSPFESTFAADIQTGHLNWVSGCKGDTYDQVPINGILYSIAHAHNCSSIGGNPELSPRQYQWTQATSTTPRSDGAYNSNGSYTAYHIPELYHWQPTFNPGSYTGQSQSGWTITGNSNYVLIGGEFPTINGIAQQGLVRFAISSIAPNKEGPQGYAQLKPTLVSLGPGTERVSWQAAWDRDNRQLTYEVLRGTSLNTATVVKTFTYNSEWWARDQLTYTDNGLTPGSSQTYRIRVTDPFGNVKIGDVTAGTVQSGTAQASPYGNAVRADSPSDYYRLDEPSGTTSYDYVGSSDLTVDSSATRGTTGALTNESDTATTFSGGATVPATTSNLVAGPQTFTAEAWVNTTSTSGGKIIGFGDSTTGDSSNYDRHVYMTNDGRIEFGVYPGGVATVVSTTPYNDGKWHHVAASLGAGGMNLYVDGTRVGHRSDVTSGQPYNGYWRVGGDNLGGWPDQPSSNKFTGAIDEVAIYPSELSPARVQAHFTAGGGTVFAGTRPSDTYGQTVFDAQPDFYWRLNDAVGATSVADVTANSTPGVAAGGPTFGAAGVSGIPGTAVQLDGADDSVGSSKVVNNPTTYSEELWFNTTTTHGGKLIGFGDQQSGSSSNYDRHVYMFDTGQLRFGAYTGQLNVADTTASYNDGKWHHMVATEGGDGMKLYVDGALAASNPNTGAQNFSGYWRIGGDNTWGGATSNYFAGTIDEAAVYSSVLTPAQVLDHYTKGGGQPANNPPSAAFTSQVSNLAVAFDGSTSKDTDGTIAGYSWNFGDNTPAGTGVNPTHTYAAAGSYPVTLTVTDNQGATGTATNTVTAVAPPVNNPPTAAFTSQVSNLAVAFDGSTSKDTDGTIAGYSWNFGDNTPAGTGVNPTHTYAAAGSYPVTVTVTDNQGATGTATNTVTAVAPPVNNPPTAAFTSQVSNLAVAFDGSTSKDTDGTIAGYSWNFGDNTPAGTGVNPTHTYAAAGSYPVTLTVTDNQGATGMVTNTVTAVAPPVVYAADSFGRTVSGGLGSADTGGAWTITSGAGTDYAVTGSVGQVRAAAGKTRDATLGSVAQTDTDTKVSVALDKAQTGSGTYVALVGRKVGTAGDYRVKLKYGADGSVTASLVKNVGTTETLIKSSVVTGLTYTPGTQLVIRLQVSGNGTTTMAAKVWTQGTAEPSTWLLTGTDTTAALQSAGAVGVSVYATSSIANGPITASFDDLSSGPRQTP